MKKVAIIVGVVLLSAVPTAVYLTYRSDRAVYTSTLANQEHDPQPMPIPPLIDVADQGDRIEIPIIEGETEFFPGVASETKGYNGTFLGPTIRAREGQDVTIVWDNQTTEVTNVHKHGLHVPGVVDGGPQTEIAAGESLEETLEIRQRASTNWYHPHIMGITAIQAYDGLAGLFYIEDDHSDTLDLPHQYGVDDIPLVIQDRAFIDGEMTYTAFEGDHMSMMNRNATWSQIEDGEMLGNTIIANGAVNAYQEVPQGWTRLRVLNGANARILPLAFTDNREFFMIASDGGFLPDPVPLTRLTLSPGERAELLVDFSDGTDATLLTGEEFDWDLEFDVVEFRVNDQIQHSGTLPDGPLATIEPYRSDDVAVTRTFVMNDYLDSGTMGINGVSMDLDVINETVVQGELEKWIVAVSEDSHPFHAHGTSFQVISRDAGEVPLHEQGWKDTVYVTGTVELLVRFDYEATPEFPYMYHCHILEHEDMGMMGQFTVVPPGTTTE